MATQILVPGITALESSSFTLADGQATNLFMIGADNNTAPYASYIEVQVQGSGSGWATCFAMVNPSAPDARAAAFDASSLRTIVSVPSGATARIEGPGIFRVKRSVCLNSVGVERA